jgi:hypothetical protein
MASRKCLICSSSFSGRRDAKTCSARCRKRLQKVKWSFLPVPAKRQLVKTLMVLFVGMFSIVGISLSQSAKPVSAATSSYLNFQSRLLTSSGAVVADGNYNIEFKITNDISSADGGTGACSGSCLWRETRQNSNSQGVRVVNGYLSVNLGSVTSFPAINWDQQLYLTMNIAGTGVGASPTYDGEMSPRVTLTALPYAFRAGTLAKTDGSGNVGTLSFNTTANTPVITLPDATGTVCLQSSSSCGFLTSTTGVQLQGSTPGSQQTGHFNISGTGIAGTSLLTPALDVASAGTLSIGTSTATSITIGSTSAAGTITLGQSTASNTISIGGAAGNGNTQTVNIGNSSTGGSTTNVNIGSSIGGITAITGPTTVTNRTSGSSDTFNVSNSTSTGTIALFKDNSTTVFNLADGGAALFQNQTNTTSAFQVQNSGGNQLLNIDTTNSVTDLTNNGNNNLITNGSFETNTTGWSARGSSTLSQDSTQYYIGNKSLKDATTAAADDGAKYNLTTTTLASNTKYTFLASVRMSPGTNMSTLQLGRSEDGSADTSCLTAQTVTSDGWTNFSCTFTTGTTSGTPYVYIKQTDATARNFYIDAAQLTRYSLLANASIEQAIAGNWTAKGTPTIHARNTTIFNDGTASLKITTQATANQGTQQSITLQDSTTYLLSFNAYLDTTDTPISTLEAGYSSDGSTDNTVCTTAQTVSNGWSTFTCRIVTPASHSGTPYIYIKNTAAGARTFYLDNIRLSMGNPLGSYKEGLISLNGVISSPSIFQNQTNSNGAFQIQNASGNSLFNADTSNFNVTLQGGNAGDVQPWQTNSSSGFTGQDSHCTVTAHGYFYAIGGEDGSANPSNMVQYAKINANGSLGNWSTTTAITINGVAQNRAGAGCSVINGYVYVIAGTNNTGFSGAQSSVYYAKLNTDGTVGSWSSATSIPAARVNSSSVTSNGYLYSISGYTSASSSTQQVYYTKVNADGTLGAWSTDALPIAASDNGSVVLNGYLYVTQASFPSNTVYYTQLSASTGAPVSWSATTAAHPVASTGAGTYAANGYLYLTGGSLGSGTHSRSTFFAKPTSTGDITTWSTSSQLIPATTGRTDFGQNGVVANGYLYVVGGSGFGVAAQSTQYYTSVARTSIGGSLDLVGVGGQSLADGGTGGSLTAGNTRIVGNLGVQGQAMFSQGVTVDKSLVVNGDALIKSYTNVTSAFQVQNANGAQLLNIDTTNPVTDLTTNSTANLVTNGSFEDGSLTTGWAARGSSTLSQITTRKYIGNASLSVATTAAANDGAKYNLTTTSLATGTSYTLTLSVRLAATTSTDPTNMSTLAIGRAEDGSTDTSCLSGQSVNSVGWTTFSCTFTTGTTSGTPYIYVKQTDATARTFYVDGVQLTRNNILQNYSIEQAIAGNWTAKGTPTTHARNTTGFYQGTANLEINTQAVANQGTKQSITLNDSTTYSLSFYAISNSAAALTTMEAGYSSDGATDNTVCTTGQTLSTVGYQQYTCSFTTPSSHSGTPYIYIKNSAATVRDFFLDSITLSTGNTFTAYREGIISLNGIINSPTVFQNQTDSTSAFQIQNASGGQLLNIDTLNSVITLNGNNAATLQPWKTATALPANRDNARSFIANGYLYAVGGDGLNTIVYNKINTDGSLSAAWTTNTYTLPAIRGYIGVTTANGYVYVVGGSIDSGVTAESTVYYAKLRTDGSIGPFAVTSSLPADRAGGGAVAYGGYIYYGGGIDDTPTTHSDVYYAKLNTDGSVGTWTTTSSLPAVRTAMNLVQVNGYLYEAGGVDGSNSEKETVFYSKLNSDGTLGSWNTSSTTTQTGRATHGVVALNGYLYEIGGSLGGGGVASNTTIYAPLNSDGSTGTWSTTANNMPVGKMSTAYAAANGYVYMLGGYDGSNPVNSVYYTSGPRIVAGGSLDLVNLGGKNLSEDGASGALTAGNTKVIGTLEVQDQATFNRGVYIGKELTVGSSANFQNSTNSSTAFQIQNASGVSNINVTTVNLVSNTTFESGATNIDNTVDGWVKKLGSETSIKVQNSNAQFGSNSMEAVTTTTAQQGVKYPIAMLPSTQYTFSFYAKISASSFATLTFGRSDTGASGGETNCVTTGSISTTYARFSCTFTTGATMGASGKPYLYISKGTDTTARTIYIDGVQLETGASASTYTEGNIKLDGQITVKNSSDSVNAFQIQTSSTQNVFTADTTNQRIGIGTAAPTTTLHEFVSNTQTALPMTILEQNGAGDTTIQLKNNNTSTSYYIGQDNSNDGRFSINSGVSAATSRPAFVQSRSSSLTAASAGTIALAYTSNTTAGNALVAAVSWSSTGGATTFTCAGGGNTYATTAVRLNTVTNRGLGICYAFNITGGATTITATFTGGNAANREIAIAEYSNIATASAFDVSSVSPNSATSGTSKDGATSGSATTTQAGDLLFGAYEDADLSINGIGKEGTNFNGREIDNAGGLLIEDKIHPAASSVAATFSSTLSHNYIASMITLKPSTTTVTDTYNNNLFSLTGTGQALFKNVTDASRAFQIQNAAGNTMFFVNTIGYFGRTYAGAPSFVAVDDNSDPALLISTNTNEPIIDTYAGNTLHLNPFSNGTVDVGQSSTADFRAYNNATVSKTFTNNGAALFNNTADSTTAFQVQKASAGQVLFAVDTQNSIITFSGSTSTFVNITLNNAHFKSTQTTAPAIATPTTCGTTPTASVTAGSTDSAGSLTISNGTGTGQTCSAVVTFNKTYGAAPKSIIITPKDANATNSVYAYVSATSATTFTVTFKVAAAVSTSYNFYYWIIE